MKPIAIDFKLPEDGFIHLVPRGEFRRRVRDARGKSRDVVQVVDDEALAAMAAAFAEATKAPNWCGLLLDYDHGSLDCDKSSEAAGWIESVEVRADGLWGHVRWSDRGAEAIKGGRYRYVSPVWLVDEMQDMGGGERYRPTRLAPCALTNDPWFDREIMPITHRKETTATTPAATPPKTRNPKMEELKKLLGLAPETPDAEVLAAVQALQQQSAEMRKQADAKAAEAAAVASRKAAEEQADKDMAEFAVVVGELPEPERAGLREALVQSRAVTRASLILMGRKADGQVDPTKAALPNSKAAAGAAGPKSDEDLAAEFTKSAELKAEFGNDCAAFVAYRRASDAGRIRRSQNMPVKDPKAE